MKQPYHVQTFRLSLNSNVWEDKLKEYLYNIYNNYKNIEVKSVNYSQVKDFLLVTIIYKQLDEYILPSGGWRSGDRNFD